jgi:TonB family protein
MLDSNPIASLARALAPLLIALPLVSGCGAAATNEGAPGGGGLKTPDAESESFLRVGEVHKQPESMPSDGILGGTGSEAASAAPTTSAAPKLPSDHPVSHATAGLEPPKEAEDEKRPERQLSNPPAGDSGGGKKNVRGAVVESGDGLSEAEVRGAIVQKQGSFRECYEIGTRASSGFSGTVSLRVSITPAGTVGAVEVLSSTTKNSQVDSCVADAVRKIQFPAKGNGAVVGFPIEFGG